MPQVVSFIQGPHICSFPAAKMTPAWKADVTTQDKSASLVIGKSQNAEIADIPKILPNPISGLPFF